MGLGFCLNLCWGELGVWGEHEAWEVKVEQNGKVEKEGLMFKVELAIVSFKKKKMILKE